MTKYGSDLTSGSIPKNLFKFAMPVFLANFLSSGYAIINTIWVGHLLGGVAVAAVAVTFPIFLFLVAIANGATTASSVMIAHSFGAGKNDEIQHVVNTSWGFGAILILLTSVAGIAGADLLLRMLNTSDIVRIAAVPFLKLSIMQFAFLYLSFLLSSTLRSVGNSRLPLIFTAIGTALNAVFDPLLIMGVGPFPRLGLNGAAIASLLTNCITAVAAFVYLKEKYSKTPLMPKKIELNGAVIRQILGIGFPTFIQQTLISVSVAVITVFVNRFGPDATAAFGITGRIESMVIMPAIAMLVAVSTLTAQAIGAGKVDKIPVIYKWGLIINTPVIAIVCLLSIFFPAVVMHIFVSNETIISIGSHYLRIVGWGYLLMIVVFVSNGLMIGSKNAMMTMIFSIVSLILCRIPLAGFLSGTKLGLTGIWIALTVSFLINALLGIGFYFSGKWRPSVIKESENDVMVLEAEEEGAENISNV